MHPEPSTVRMSSIFSCYGYTYATCVAARTQLEELSGSVFRNVTGSRRGGEGGRVMKDNRVRLLMKQRSGSDLMA
jgi:hypothetical protein